MTMSQKKLGIKIKINQIITLQILLKLKLVIFPSLIKTKNNLLGTLLNKSKIITINNRTQNQLLLGPIKILQIKTLGKQKKKAINKMIIKQRNRLKIVGKLNKKRENKHLHGEKSRSKMYNKFNYIYLLFLLNKL